MNIMILLIVGIFYFSLIILIFGFLIRAIIWYVTKPSTIATALYPLPEKKNKVYHIVTDIFTLPGLLENNPRLWIIVGIFHLSLLGILIGHFHLIGTFPDVLEKWLESTVVEGLGATLGLLGLICILLFFFRRITASLRKISYWGDYLILLLFLGAFASGEVLRISSINIGVFQEYARSLLFIQPNIPHAIEGSLSAWLFLEHLLLVSLLFIYLPFSSLMHLFGSFSTNYWRRDTHGMFRKNRTG